MTPSKMKMTKEEAKDCVLLINENLGSAAAAMMELRDRGGWKSLGYNSWKECCREEFHRSPSYAFRLINAEKLKTQLAPRSEISTPKPLQINPSTLPIGNALAETLNEGQARVLGTVPVEDRPKVLEIAQKSGPLTAKAIAAAKQELAAAKASVIPGSKEAAKAPPKLDNVGRVIPPGIVDLWNRSELEAKEALQIISRMRTALATAQELDDLAYRELTYSTSIARLDNLYSDFKRVTPYAVCKCEGLRPEKCTSCKGRGFVSEFYWKLHIPEEYKKLVSKL